MAKDFSSGPKRTILYYPTIPIPNSSWLRQALLYFDEVASIVPSVVSFSHEVGKALVPLTPDIEYLQDKGAFRRIPPEFPFMQEKDNNWERARKLTNEFKEAIKSEPFKRLLDANKHHHKFVELHRGKLEDTSWFNFTEYLLAKNLIKFDERHTPYGEWILVEENTALLYMSLLAQALADVDKEWTVTGTDRREYERLVFDATSPHNGFACLDTRFCNVLPVPINNVPFAKILRFREKRTHELLHFRQKIDELQRQLSTVTEQREINEILAQSRNSLQVGLNDLTQQLHDDRILTRLGSVKCLMNVQSPTAWISALLLAAPLAGVHVATAPLALPIIAVAGTVEVGYHLVTKRNEERAKLRASPFAYLYHAHAEGLLGPID